MISSACCSSLSPQVNVRSKPAFKSFVACVLCVELVVSSTSSSVASWLPFHFDLELALALAVEAELGVEAAAAPLAAIGPAAAVDSGESPALAFRASCKLEPVANTNHTQREKRCSARRWIHAVRGAPSLHPQGTALCCSALLRLRPCCSATDLLISLHQQ